MFAPTNTQLNDLSALLQLMQAANDPVKTQEAIDGIRAEREKYDDAISVSNARMLEAEQAIAKAEAAVKEMNEKSERLDAHQKSIDSQSAELANRSKLADEREAAVAAKEAAAVQVEADAANRESMRTTEFNQKMAKLADVEESLRVKREELDAAAVRLQTLKLDYEDKLAKFKAITE